MAVLYSLAGCTDDLMINEGGFDGRPAQVECTIDFNPLQASTLGRTRSAADANKYMRNIFVVVYKGSEPEEGADLPLYVYDYDDLKETLRREEQSGMPGDATDNGNLQSGNPAESVTHRYSMRFPDFFDAGTYRIYAALNIDNDDVGGQDVKEYLKTLGAKELRRLTMTWQPMKLDSEAETGEQKPSEKDYGNAKDGFENDGRGINDQMFGYFTADNDRMSRPLTAGQYAVDNPSQVKGGEYTAPEVSIGGGGTVKLHAWVRRLASKVTLVFNSSGLHERVFVYVHKATIKDIPRTCQLGVENSVKVKSASATDRNLLLRPEGESFYYYTGTAEGAEDNVNDTHTHSRDLYPDDYTKWMRLSKGSSQHGAVGKDANGNEVTHGEDMAGLYFYENLQGKYNVDQAVIDGKDKPDGPKPDGTEYYKGQLGNQINDDQSEGKPGFKDNVFGGTYIEVEGFYVSQNPANQSSGSIKFRCMLGQNMTSDYNCFRSCHYKLTLNFKGYGNQADWHIEYMEEDPGVFPPLHYNVSYLYGMESEYPIRITGNVDKVVVQIVENNWAPFDSTNVDSIPKQEPEIVGDPSGILPFRWARDIYVNEIEKNKNKVDYYYGLHDQKWYTGGKDNGPKDMFKLRDFSYYEYTYNENSLQKNGKVTPIWAGFLALKAPTGYTDRNTVLPVGIFDTPDKDWYLNDGTGSDKGSVEAMRDYYLGVVGKQAGHAGTTINSIPQHEAVYDVTLTDEQKEKTVGNDRNSYRVVRNGDGTKTLYIPVFTRPKSIIYISGFSGNNPYETYKRKAVLRVSGHYILSDGSDDWKETYSPVFQVRRITNPKAVWRSYDNKDDFHVTLYRLETAISTNFVPLISNGEWRAFLAAGGDNGYFTLDDGKDTVRGSTGDPIKFKIGFKGCGKTESKCALVRVEYDGYTCFHPIYLRQGVNAALAIDDGKDAALWSSYSVYKFNTTATTVPYPDGTVEAELTQSPLALGTMFKRGNLKQGILISNNKTWGPSEATNGITTIYNAELELSDGTKTTAWKDIKGYARTNAENGVTTSMVDSWKWPDIKATVVGESREYSLPTYAQYEKLRSHRVALGVCYYDGATEPATNTDDAFMYLDPENVSRSSNVGMRGAIIYNSNNFKQVFFPVGAYGMGRRTVQGTLVNNSGKEPDIPGVLRYGAQPKELSYDNGHHNQYRPITYNIASNPGALYWLKDNSGSNVGWDINYFDFTFGPYDALIYKWNDNTPKDGDAVPIKLVRKK